MRIEPIELVEIELKNDPTIPKTKWTIHRLSYDQTKNVEMQVGPRPVQAFFIYGRVHPARTREEIEEERKLPADEQKKRVDNRVNEALNRLRKLSESDRASYDIAIDWLERYDFAVCAQGLELIDGKPAGNVYEVLNEMRPVESVRVVVGELANKITKLAEIEDEKKEPSPSPAG